MSAPLRRNPGESMKRFASMLTLVIGGFAAFATCAAEEYKDGCSVEPKNCKILKEQGKVRVIDYTAKAGDKVGMHSHPAHVVYVLKGGKTKFTSADGKVTELDAKAGDVFINPPTVHASEHVTDVHVIIVEMSE
jgi:quercetin dioxygenase-like cupin family protein